MKRSKWRKRERGRGTREGREEREGLIRAQKLSSYPIIHDSMLRNTNCAIKTLCKSSLRIIGKYGPELLVSDK